MAYVHFAHDCQIGSQDDLRQCLPARGARAVGDWAILGATTLVHQFVRIGAHAFTGMGTYLPQDRAAVRHGGGQHAASPTASTAKGSSDAAFTGGDRRAEARLSHAVSQRARSEDAKRELEAQAADCGEVRPILDFLASSTAASSARWRAHLRVGMVAGEASGDLLAAHLIARAQGAPPADRVRRHRRAAHGRRGLRVPHVRWRSSRCAATRSSSATFGEIEAIRRSSPRDAAGEARPVHRRRTRRASTSVSSGA
jgi:hypothetical protein